jgi:hypothetical protein
VSPLVLEDSSLIKMSSDMWKEEGRRRFEQGTWREKSPSTQDEKQVSYELIMNCCSRFVVIDQYNGFFQL